MDPIKEINNLIEFAKAINRKYAIRPQVKKTDTGNHNYYLKILDRKEQKLNEYLDNL